MVPVIAALRRRWRGYLLFLVVVGAVALVFMPIVCGPRPMAWQTACLHNLKRLGNALALYAEDYDDHLPLAASWGEGLGPYCESLDLYRCPSDPFGGEVQLERGRAGSYAFNSLLDGAGPERLADPAAAPGLFDSSARLENAADPLLSWDPRHQDHGLVLFADGHVQRLREPPPADAGLRGNGGGS